jgi:hypothetical protein
MRIGYHLLTNNHQNHQVRAPARTLFARFLILAIILSAPLSLAGETVFMSSDPLIQSEQNIREYLKQVVCTKEGIKLFFTNYFNTPLYTQRILPACFIHLIDFLNHGIQTRQPDDYVTIIFTLFHQRLKCCLWVNPYALLAFLEQLPELLATRCKKGGGAQPRAERITTILIDKFTDHFTEFQRNPREFLAKVGREIDKSLAGAEALSHEVVHFLETALDKLIWNPRENLETWDSCKLIASRLEQLHACGIIPSERELNLLIWTLFCRFGYFIQSMGNQIPDKVYAAIKQDLCEPGCSCLEIGELADDVITKKEYLSIVVQQMELVHKLVHKLYSDPIETASPKASGIPKSGETVSLLKSQAHE